MEKIAVRGRRARADAAQLRALMRAAAARVQWVVVAARHA